MEATVSLQKKKKKKNNYTLTVEEHIRTVNPAGN
jgi:hypothetical protein